MRWSNIQEFADKKVLNITTIGRRTGLPREIEIWFVIYRDRFYLFAETGEAAASVKKIKRNPEVTVRVGERQVAATARVLERENDRELWDQVAAIANRKYGWGEGTRLGRQESSTPSCSTTRQARRRSRALSGLPC